MSSISRRSLILLALLLSGSCALRQAPIAVPGGPVEPAAQRETLRVIERLNVAFGLLQRLGAEVLELEESAEAAEAEAHEIPIAVEVIAHTLTALKGVSTCPALHAALAVAGPYTQPLVTTLLKSENEAVRIFGVSLQATLNILDPGGILC